MNTKILPLSIVCLFFVIATGFAGTIDSLKIIEKKNKMFLKKSAYVLIPSGSVSTMNFVYDTDDRRVIETNETPRIQDTIVNSFIMKKGEVTNSDYLEFLSHYKSTGSEKLRKVLPDTLVWRTPLAYNEPYTEYYLRHPAYQNYPVVGVSHQQAKLYCEWLTEEYHQNPDRVYKKVIYRLPTETEWIHAAKGGLRHGTYPWLGRYMRSSEGDMLANCLNFGTETVYRDTLYEKTINGEFKEIYLYRAEPYSGIGSVGHLNDASDITAPAISYWPNEYGLYNMAGNVCEMVAEVGITHGGSWRDPGYYLQNHIRQFYDSEQSASAKRGFRYVIEVIEY